MTPNELLLWMSARRQGSWQQFRGAVEELDLMESSAEPGTEEDTGDRYSLPHYQVLRLNLQRLGHAEFFGGAGGSEWRVTPPSLAITQHSSGWLGVVAGARSLGLLARLKEVASGVECEAVPIPACPDQLRMRANDSRVLAGIAEAARLLGQPHAPVAILMSLPAVDDATVSKPAQLPFGADWRIDQWTPDGLGWRATRRDEAVSAQLGLFRFSLRHQRHFFLCSRGATYRVPGQVGKYIVLRRRRRQVLRYDTAGHRLLVPASCRPPLLVERALILCSGLPPSYTSGVLEYPDVPPSVAALAAALLRQDLR